MAALGIPVAPVVLIFGLLVGSFLNVVIARLPEGESIVRPRSRCPKCGYMIPSWLNVPVLSWLVLRGKCASCKTPISIRYPMIELLTGMLFLACYTRFGLSWALLLGFWLCGSMVAITFIDIRWWEIPDEISLPGVVIGIVLRPLAFDVPWWDGLLGAVLGYGFLWVVRVGYELVRKREGMGLGDLKLLAMIGAFLGLKALLPVILVASFSGSLVGGALLLVRRIRGDVPEDDAEAEAPAASAGESEPAEPASGEEAEASEDAEDEEEWEPDPDAVPFGPFLAMGSLFVLLYGHLLERWYLLARL